jgi:hypothetical protein
MKNQLPKESYKLRISKSGSASEVVERRSAKRKPFIAEALIVELDSGAKLRGRSCDLVVHGCYVDTLNPFPQGTLVRIRIQHGDARIEAKGKVVYRVPSLGMGIAFYDLTLENQATLNEWLSHVNNNKGIFEASLPPIQIDKPRLPQPEEGQAARLIQVLRKKGILTETEVAELMGLQLND